ncbi:MAG: TlpA disulfide reductase family protein [Polaribacter sp.]|nr:TlpA disulfide reductase family protein [Polaribacter sp.]
MNNLLQKTLFILFIAFASCKSEPKIDYAIVSGKITNSDSEKTTLYKTDMSIKKKIEISADGTFNDTIKSSEGIYYVLRNGNDLTSIYLADGNNIEINYDAKDYDNTLQIRGTGSEYSNYLREKNKKSSDLVGKGTDIYTKEEAEYKKTFQDIKQAKGDILFNYVGLSDDFKQSEKRNINYEYLSNINIYEIYHAYYSKKKDFKASEDFLNVLADLDYTNEEDFKFSSSYAGLVSSYYSKKTQDLIKKDSLLDYSITMLNVSSKIENETIKNSLLYNESKYSITYTDDLETFYNIFIKNSTNEKNNEEITKSYNALKEISKGKDSPKFTNYENNAGGTTSLDDLKGKYVYVDVWATWCAPCIAEIPSLKKIEKKYHNKNIEFVSLSIDNKKDHEQWKKMIVDKELGGMQLFADNNWESKFIQDYLIKGIPRFILLDPNGVIISSNAPRPSDKKLTKMLDELNL